MNERIKEIAEKAVEVVSYNSRTGRETKELNLEKFAEMIITAVMAEVKDEVQYHCGWENVEIVENRVKKVFGVEE
jgi:hypothetical protein